MIYFLNINFLNYNVTYIQNGALENIESGQIQKII